MSDFKVGDVVYLKSGSLPMTITSIESNGHAHVTWQGLDGNLKYGYHPLGALTKQNPYKEPPPSKVGF